eukprot:TRINITY_DN3994_c1_g1_i4.p1 TRINITY_DN3994_c1_g1~~TRINITY_DN3994_c1_g1_i4.p1  ORF type:complete len:704 (+),score=83.02 TRINITY_DN3994_c1_g1_i4:175-2286(+)
MTVNTDAGNHVFADDLLGKQLRLSSVKSWLQDAPLAWLLAVNSTQVLFTYVMLSLWLLVMAILFMADALILGTKQRPQAVSLLALGVVMFLCGSAARIWRRNPVFVEILCLVYLAIVELCLWIGIVFIPDVELRQRSLAFMTVLFNTFASLLDMRLMPNIFMSVWVWVGNLAASYGSRSVHGDEFSMRHFGVITVVAVLYFCQARMHQFRLRCLYDGQKHGLDHISAMETVLAMLSDGTAWLASDGNTVCKCDSRLQANLGVSLGDGLRLSDALWDVNEVDRIAETVKRAHEGPALITSSFACSTSTEEKVEVEVLVVNVEGTLHGPYLVCFRRATQSVLPGAFGAPVPCARREVELPNFLCSVLSESASGGSEHQDMLSVAETTNTGQLFEAIRVAAKHNQCIASLIEQVVDLGVSEHWLLPASVVDLKPDVILGTGGFGHVIEADYLGLRVAVKMSKSSTGGTSRLSVILNELRVLRCVRHPNIVLFFGAFIRGPFYDVGLVFERINGRSLDTCVHSFPCTITKLGIAVDLCCALWYLHSQTPVIVHGDIKTPNILVEVRGDSIIAKLADFGLSRLVSKTTVVLGGSLYWLAPEVIRDPIRRPTLSVDVFSFGRLLFCIMFGTNSFCENASPATWKDMSCLNIVMPFSEFSLDFPLSRESRAICELCILPDAEKRPTMDSVHSELVSWFDKLEVSSQKCGL